MRLVHGKELPVPKAWNSRLPTWEPQVTFARNCRFPVVGTPGSQPGNHGLALQATADSQRLELLVPNLETIGYHFKELPVPKSWNSRFQTWEPQVTIARNCWIQEVGTDSSQPGNHRLPLQRVSGFQKLELTFANLGLPWQATAGSQTLKLTVPNLGTRGYHSNPLPLPRG